MSSTFIEHSPKAEEDKSLILIMDGDGNVTADPVHFEKLISAQKIPDMGIKIVRLDSHPVENEGVGTCETKQELKLTVEEIYPESLPLIPGDASVNVASSSLEILPGPSNEHIAHDIVDPFSQMDPEQLQRLEHALASEQAKQILGENVAAMLDMLNVDDSPAAFLQNSIKNDHCYTNLSPSSDPNGPSFFSNDTRQEANRGKGKAKVGTPVKGKKVVTHVAASGVGNIKKQVVKDGKLNAKLMQVKQTTLLDYGATVSMSQSKCPNQIESQESNFEEDVDVEESEDSVDLEEDNFSDEDYNNRSSKSRRKPRKSKKKVIVKSGTQSRPFGKAVVKTFSRLGKRSVVSPEMKTRNEKLNDAMSKIVESLEDAEETSNFKKGFRKIKPKAESVPDNEKVVIKDSPKVNIDSLPGNKVQAPKYPKRENRKPPAHLAEAFGPALFSAPDIIRRVSTNEEIVPATPEKKNFTVGAKMTERGLNKLTPTKTDSPINDIKIKARVSTKEPVKNATLLKSSLSEGNKFGVKESREERSVVSKALEAEAAKKKATVEIQKLIEKHQVKPTSDYEEEHDFSDENINENYYLDPTQMDQSLLEGFGQTVAKNEDQLLQEAILLQEHLIDSNKGIVLPLGETMNLEENQVHIPFDTETIEDIQNEITSAILVAHEEGKPEKQVNETDVEKTKVVSVKPSFAESKKETELEKSASENEQEECGKGNLVVDESKPEDRRRNSAKRRRSDEVSDLDSDLDDALSEASWNSEDDPDRLWCICRKPHNNRFMICCDVCEEWFHGKCVGITKSIGKQMEQDGLEWSCPNCTKKKKVEEHDREADKIKLLKEKMAQSIKEQQLKMKESQKLKSQGASGREKTGKSQKTGPINLKQTKISDFSHISSQGSEEEETVGRKCIMCKGPVRENSIYCSDDCIRKHSQHAISQLMGDKKSSSESSGPGQGENIKMVHKAKKEESHIVVMDPNSKKFLVGHNAPTAANLTTWLKENPSYHVVYKKTDKPGKILLTSRKVVKIATKPGESQKVFVQAQKVGDSVKSTQLKLAVSPNSKQINILQPGAGKKVYQIVSSTSPGGKQTAFLVKPKQTEVIDALPLPAKAVVSKPPIKIKEATSPKNTSVQGLGKEAVAQKPEKIQRKRKERTLSAKDPKMGQSVDEGKEKDKEKKDADQQIRESVKKTLAETLKARVQENKNLEYNEEAIDNLVIKIEEKLFKHFENKVDTKYKSKYRSLVFNIKDPKNETLYKKIVDNSISPKELVKLSPEELASQELARWREKENQHQLEMIKKTELELMTKGNTYIMKSHKGEQVIESDQSEKVAAVAAEIDPNTPAQELVSALNSVTSTTQDVNEEEEKKKENSETSLMKMRKKEKERRRSRDRKHDKRDKDRKRSNSRNSRSRSHHSKNKKRSRSRSRDKEKDKSKYKYKENKSEKKKEKESKENCEYAEEKKEGIVDCISDETEMKSVKKPMEDDEADREPSSTVIIKTPDINVDEHEVSYLWKGCIVMADVAKFSGVATEISGDCGGLAIDIPEKVDVVGRIPYDTVWDYIARMKKMGTKDILVIKIVAGAEEEKPSYGTLYSYLSKRSRIGVIGKTSDAVKDFYLYPLASHSPLPQVLLPLEGPPYEGDRENVILGIVVRNKHRSRHLGVAPTDNTHKTFKKGSAGENEGLSFAETGMTDRSYTPPLPDKEQEVLLKKERQKRKIKVRMDYKEISSKNEEVAEDDDSPYSPGDSDEDLPPLPKIAKPSVPSISTSISKLLTPCLPLAGESNLPDPTEIQRKIEEMNRAIEEQTQQIQSLTSAVPKLSSGVVLPTLPLLGNVTSSILTPSIPSPSSYPDSSTPKPLLEKVQLPLILSEPVEQESKPAEPPKSFTPPLKVEENIPFLPEVTSKISLPSNLQEILNAIQKKAGSEDSVDAVGMKEPAKVPEEIIKIDNPDLTKALSVLNQTKNILDSLTPAVETSKEEKSGKSQLSRLSDQELLMKAKEMEMELEREICPDESPALLQSMNPPCPQPLPPGIQDIPLIPPSGVFSNPPPAYFSKPLLPSASLVETHHDKKLDKKAKLDPKSVFDNEGVPEFVNIPGSGWEDRKGQKPKNFKIDIKLTMNSLEQKSMDVDRFEIESISKMPEIPEDRSLPSGSGLVPKPAEESRYDVDDRVLSKPEEKYKSGRERDRRRSDDRETKRDWKYRRHWDEDKRYKDDYRRHGRRDRPGGKFRKERFDHKASRHLQMEWDGSIKNFEERQRWRNQEIRREEMRRSRKRADSSSN